MRIERKVADTLVPGNVNMEITKANQPEPAPNYIVRLTDFSGSREHEFVFQCKSAAELRKVWIVINTLMGEILGVDGVNET